MNHLCQKVGFLILVILLGMSSFLSAQNQDPLVLFAFSAKYNSSENIVEVRWILETQDMNATYEVIRVYEDLAFDVVETVRVGDSGQRDFLVKDRFPNPGTNFYRVRKVNDEGVLKVSPIVALKLDERALQLARISPNPAHKFLTIRTFTHLEEPALLRLTNIEGHEFVREEIVLKSGLNKFELDVRPLPAGPYFFLMRTGIYQVSRLIFVVH